MRSIRNRLTTDRISPRTFEVGLWFVECENVSVPEEQNPIAPGCLIEVVRRDENCRPVRATLPEGVPHRRPEFGIKPDGRLVKDQMAGVVNESTRETGASDHASGESGDPAVGTVR